MTRAKKVKESASESTKFGGNRQGPVDLKNGEVLILVGVSVVSL